MAGPVLQMLEGGIPASSAEADPGRLGLGRKVGKIWLSSSSPNTQRVFTPSFHDLDFFRTSVIGTYYNFPPITSTPLVFRLQREEEAAYASSQGVQSHSQSTPPQQPPGHASLGPFSKFEEKKTNEKTRKVTTVKKFFSPSSRSASKKGIIEVCALLVVRHLKGHSDFSRTNFKTQETRRLPLVILWPEQLNANKSPEV